METSRTTRSQTGFSRQGFLENACDLEGGLCFFASHTVLSRFEDTVWDVVFAYTHPPLRVS